MATIKKAEVEALLEKATQQAQAIEGTANSLKQAAQQVVPRKQKRD